MSSVIQIGEAVGVENGPFLLLWPVAYKLTTACTTVQAVITTLLGKILHPFYFLNNTVKPRNMLIIFGTREIIFHLRIAYSVQAQEQRTSLIFFLCRKWHMSTLAYTISVYASVYMHARPKVFNLFYICCFVRAIYIQELQGFTKFRNWVT